MADRRVEPPGGPDDPVESDAARWDRRYEGFTPSADIDPPPILRLVAEHVSPATSALDLASGFGDGGLFLAQLGARVTCVDVSSVALAAIAARARSHGVPIRTERVDLLTETLPIGPWDLASCVHFLDRKMLSHIPGVLAPRGLLVAAIATTVNLERHARPSARFLLQPDELPDLIPRLDIVHHDETWRSNGSHEAWVVARKP